MTTARSSPAPPPGSASPSLAVLAQRGWHLVLDARDADRSGGRGRVPRPDDRRRGSRLDVADPAHREALAGTVGRAGGSTCSSTTPATSGPARSAPCATSTPTTFVRILASTVAAPLRAHPARSCRRCAASRGTVVDGQSSDAAVEPTRAGAATAPARRRSTTSRGDLRGRGARPALCTPSTPATCAPQLHQDAFPGEDISDRPLPETVVPPLLHLLDAARQRPLPGRRRRCRRDRRSPTVRIPSSPRRSRPRPTRPRCRGCAATRCGCSSRRPAGIEHERFRDLARLLDARRPPRRQHLGHGRGRGRRHRAAAEPVSLHVAAPLDDGSGSSSSAPPDERRRRCSTRGPATRSPLPGGGAAAACWPATPARVRRRPAWRPAVAARSPVPTATSACLRAQGRPDRATATCAARCPLADYQTVYAATPGSAEMPSAGRPFTPGCSPRCWPAASRSAPIVCTPACRPGGGRGAAARAVRRDRRRRAALVNADPRRTAVGSSRSGTTVTRALETATERRRRRARRRGLDRLVIGPDRPVRVVDGLLTGWHEPEASHLLLLEAVAGAELTRAGLRRGPRQRLPLARVRRLLPAAAALTHPGSPLATNTSQRITIITIRHNGCHITGECPTGTKCVLDC